MMRPWPASTMVPPKIWQARSVPVRLVSITRDQSASSTSSVGDLCVTPAAFTRMSILPNCWRTASCRACTETRSSTSLATRIDLRPSASISSATLLTSSRRRELGTTFAPASASPSEIAWPSPVVPPVTTATLPPRSNRLLLISVSLLPFPTSSLYRMAQPAVISLTSPTLEIYHVRRFTSGLEGFSLFHLKDEPEGSEGQANWGRLLSGLSLSQISSRRRGRGSVGIGSIDFQGLWKRRRLLFPVVFSMDRHSLDPVVRPLLRGESQLFEQRTFGLLHAACCFGVAEGAGDSLQCVDTHSLAQILCRFIQR